MLCCLHICDGLNRLDALLEDSGVQLGWQGAASEFKVQSKLAGEGIWRDIRIIDGAARPNEIQIVTTRADEGQIISSGFFR